MEVISGGLNLKATELRLGLPGSDECEDMNVYSVKNNKRSSPESAEESGSSGVPAAKSGKHGTAPPPKAQIVGWPPVKNYRKNNIPAKNAEAESGIIEG